MHRNCEIFASVCFYIVTKIFCLSVRCYRMYKQPTLTSIPERNEVEEPIKWVPKKKHEVLKAKYKCLKKLFQIYDASVIGILPETCTDVGYVEEEVQTRNRRKRRSHRTKTDACAGTTDTSSGDASMQDKEEPEGESIATAVMKDLQIPPHSCTSTQVDLNQQKIAATQDSRVNLNPTALECECTQTSDQHPIPYLVVNERRRPTRFQCFLNRLLGIRSDRGYSNYAQPNGHVYAASDNNITHNYCYEKRKRKPIKFRRIRRPKKIQSESALRDTNRPVILSFVQTVQKNCLMDTTPRQCPILGCNMMFYGIINYNDHLNLCHFNDKKFICHYCHEGFTQEHDKFVHENEHIGISKLANFPTSLDTQTCVNQTSNTQTETEVVKTEQEEKLKKIVSFFEKINDPELVLSAVKNRALDPQVHLPTCARSKVDIPTTVTSDSDKRTISCVQLNRKVDTLRGSSEDSDATSKCSSGKVSCRFCGENFDYRRQLSLHVDLEHRVHDKFSKFHSCAGILNTRSNHVDMISEDGKINFQTFDKNGIRRVNTSSTLNQDSTVEISRRKSEETLSCDASTNILCYTSTEVVKKPSVINNIVQKVRGFSSYKWEPGTKIIRV